MVWDYWCGILVNIHSLPSRRKKNKQFMLVRGGKGMQTFSIHWTFRVIFFFFRHPKPCLKIWKFSKFFSSHYTFYGLATVFLYMQTGWISYMQTRHTHLKVCLPFLINILDITLIDQSFWMSCFHTDTPSESCQSSSLPTRPCPLIYDSQEAGRMS